MEGARLLSGGAWAGALVGLVVIWLLWTFWRRGVLVMLGVDDHPDDLGSVSDEWQLRHEKEKARSPGGPRA